jgi:TP901 family phage tail tape measure protein
MKAKIGAAIFQQATTTVQQSANQASKAVNNTSNEIRKLETTTKNLSTTVKTLITSLGLSITVAGILKILRDFETGVVNVDKIAKFTSTDLEYFEKRIISLSTAIPSTTNELLKISQEAARLGIEGVNNIELFTETIAKLDKSSTSLKGADAATSLARILNVTNEDISGVRTLAGVILRLGDTTTVNEAKIASMAKEVARAGAIFKVSSTDIAGISAAFADAGTEASVAATTFGKVMRTIESAVIKGGKELDLLAKVAGISSKELKELWNSNTADAFGQLLKGLSDIKNSGGSVSQILEAIGIKDERILRTIQPLIYNYKLYAEAIKTARDEQARGTYLNELHEKQLQTLDSQITILRTSLEAVVLNLRDSTGDIANFVKYISELVRYAGGVSEFADNSKEASIDVKILGEALKYASLMAALLIASKIAGYIASIGINAKGASLALTSHAKAVGVVAAAYAGWELGKWAHDNFGAVRENALDTIFALDIAKDGILDFFDSSKGGELTKGRQGGNNAFENSREYAMGRKWQEWDKERSKINDVADSLNKGADAATEMKNRMDELRNSGFSNNEAMDIALGNTDATGVFLQRIKSKLEDVKKDTAAAYLNPLQKEQLEMAKELEELSGGELSNTKEYLELQREINTELAKQQAIALDVQLRNSNANLILDNDLKRRYFGNELAIQQEISNQRRQYGELGIEPDAQSIAAYETLLREQQKVIERSNQINNIAEGIGDSFADSFDDAILGAKSFGEAVASLASDIQRLLLRQLVSQPIANVLTSAVGGMFGGIIPSANGNIFQNGDVVPFANGGIVNSPFMFNLNNGKRGLMGENGPEGILPLERGSDGKLGVRSNGSGGGNTIVHNHTWNINTPNADSFRRSSVQIRNEAQRAVSG